MLKVKKVMNCWINKNGTLEGSEHGNSRRLLGIFFFFLTYLQHWRVVPKWWWHTRGFSGLLTPRNEDDHATSQQQQKHFKKLLLVSRKRARKRREYLVSVRNLIEEEEKAPNLTAKEVSGLLTPRIQVNPATLYRRMETHTERPQEIIC